MELLPASPETLQQALAILRAGGIVVHATETCYGLACDLSSTKAVAKLFAVKKRPMTQPVSALFPSVEEAKRYVVWSARAEELARKYLPGPLTLILPMRTDAPHCLYPMPASEDVRHKTKDIRSKKSSILRLPSYISSTTLGVRISSHPLAQALAQGFGTPISTTSANLHGETSPYSAQALLERYAKEGLQPDLIIDNGELPPTPPSTIMDLAGEGKPLRMGDIAV